MVDQNEILDYARRIKEERPDTSKEEMQEFLEAKFLRDQDPLEAAAANGIALGAVQNPMDWLRGLGKILGGIKKWGNDKNEEAIRDLIDGVLEILY